jgi:hypothetical protein
MAVFGYSTSLIMIVNPNFLVLHILSIDAHTQGYNGFGHRAGRVYDRLHLHLDGRVFVTLSYPLVLLVHPAVVDQRKNKSINPPNRHSAPKIKRGNIPPVCRNPLS